MTNLDMLRNLFRHMEWADSRVWQSVLASPSAGADSALRDLLVHVHLVQRAFLAIWQQRAPEFPDPSSFADLAAVAAWGRDGHQQLSAWIAAVANEQLDREVAIPWAAHVEAHFGRPAAPVSLAETMMQVVSHSTHHRAQVSTRLRTLGAEPPLTDFIAWLWLAKPDAGWETRGS